MAVLTLEPALPAVRQSQRGPLTACLCLLLIVMISSSGLVAHRNLDTTIPLDAVAAPSGQGVLFEVPAAADELYPSEGARRMRKHDGARTGRRLAQTSRR